MSKPRDFAGRPVEEMIELFGLKLLTGPVRLIYTDSNEPPVFRMSFWQGHVKIAEFTHGHFAKTGSLTVFTHRAPEVKTIDKETSGDVLHIMRELLGPSEPKRPARISL